MSVRRRRIVDSSLKELSERFRRLAKEQPSDFRERIKTDFASSDLALSELLFVVSTLSAALYNHVAAREDRADVQSCSFCGKMQREVRFLVQGPMSCICEQCVAICAEILDERGIELPEREEAEPG